MSLVGLIFLSVIFFLKREPAVSGMFYPKDKKELKKCISNLLSQVPSPKTQPDLWGMILPHAGYKFSGKVAAYAFKYLENKKYNPIIIVGPYHGPKTISVSPVTFKGISVWKGGVYVTSLGAIPIDTSFTQELLNYDQRIQFIKEVHKYEHSVEVQLPFIQYILKDVKIVPIVMTDYSLEICNLLGEALSSTIQKLKIKKPLLIASSDFYHGYKYEDCKKYTNLAVSLITSYNIEGFHSLIKEGIACGGGPITAVMIGVKKLGGGKIMSLFTTNSADVIGRKEGYVVGYSSFLIKKSSKKSSIKEFPKLPKSAQKELLRYARKSLDVYLKTHKTPKFTPKNKILYQKRGAFVTLTTHDGLLRGCIGHHESDTPLYKLIPQLTIAAGVGDPRFPPLRREELKNIKIKISVYLCEVYQIQDLREFKLGVHGIILRKDNRGATFLPEVPIQEKWTKEETLEFLCKKAGLLEGCWKEGAEFYLYKTQVFEE
jgi:hypothetical protein